MPRIQGSSSKANIHPYLRDDFVWSKTDTNQEDFLCDINDEKFLEARIDEHRKARTFYFNEAFCKLLGLCYHNPGIYAVVNKNVVKEMGKLKWNIDHLSRWMALKEEQDITLRNIGHGWHVAETIWIKAKI